MFGFSPNSPEMLSCEAQAAGRMSQLLLDHVLVSQAKSWEKKMEKAPESPKAQIQPELQAKSETSCDRHHWFRVFKLHIPSKPQQKLKEERSDL